ncbi:unnamed protein product [Cyclocybe aegerita]|uniref:Major facilitator superfamily (MFS) profile domain-containing protein n=1 Tax=Cyclocybe aegerita TaxID=1973307 RepID=A0A8S0WE95_CYCAE|nr:unnamed protein product [Cyclocybe aegerita]
MLEYEASSNSTVSLFSGMVVVMRPPVLLPSIWPILESSTTPTTTTPVHISTPVEDLPSLVTPTPDRVRNSDPPVVSNDLVQGPSTQNDPQQPSPTEPHPGASSAHSTASTGAADAGNLVDPGSSSDGGQFSLPQTGTTSSLSGSTSTPATSASTADDADQNDQDTSPSPANASNSSSTSAIEHTRTMGVDPGIFKNIRVYWTAFIVYWGIVLFGYDTGIGGGVVSATYFLEHFGLLNDDGTKDQKRVDAVSSNVVSVLQAGAFFGALGSAPLSAKIGRKYTLFLFSVIFCVGAILTTVAETPERGLAEIYAGRVIAGIGIGAISAVAPAFVSECSPKEVRGRITGLFQIMVTTGVMISYFVNYGIGVHIPTGVNVWRIPFALQLVPAGIMFFGLLTVKESPRFLASVGKNKEALCTLAYLRREPIDSEEVLAEMAEIEAAIEEECEARRDLGLKEAFLGKGNLVRFVIAFVIFFFQQWTGQNSVNYYAPQIFASIGFAARKSSLLASGIYGVIKVVATTVFIIFGVETLGRKRSLFISAMGMGTFFFIIGALLKTHPVASTGTPDDDNSSPPPASKAMAAMLYIYVCFYSMGWGPLPWVYVSDIFPTRTRHYGLALASSSQWLWNFVISKITPNLVTALGYKLFLMFASINIGGMGLFSLLIPETKGRSLEEMDIIFGSISKEQRQADIEKRTREMHRPASSHSASTEQKV